MNTPRPVILPEPTLRRLPWYLAYVETLRDAREEYVSSTRISKDLDLDSSCIAKDLSFLSLKGKTRIGYEVAALEEALTDFLGFHVSHKAYLFGAGSLGSALMQDSGLSNYGLDIIGAFDTDSAKGGLTYGGITVRHPDTLREAMRENPATIAILAVPSNKAQEVADMAIAAGVRAIWNFTPCRVRVPEGVVMANTSIYAHLALIFNRLAEMPSAPEEKGGEI
ncbi:MAG: redox-sensing transcriptional repressor Rex [Muribaculaceae bacterium]|nr:redox-sensing transcriptional repressor Rex [Muribaculaceae bacterium]